VAATIAPATRETGSSKVRRRIELRPHPLETTLLAFGIAALLSAAAEGYRQLQKRRDRDLLGGQLRQSWPLSLVEFAGA
jgi:hypothetical protein